MTHALPSENTHKPSARVRLDPTLAACRDLAVKMLTESLEQFFTKLEETYFELADKSFDSKLRNDYFAARIETHNKRDLLGQNFRAYLNAAFEKSLKTDSDQKFYYVNADPDQLSLVANDEYEESLTTDRVVNSIKSKGGEELNQLEMRFARLLSAQDDEAELNPMSPEAICEAFLQACKQLETGVDARLVAMQTFERELSSQVAKVYHQVNQYLITQNVQPLQRNARTVKGSNNSSAASNNEHIATDKTQAGVSTRASDLANHFAKLSQSQAPDVQADEEYSSNGWLPFLDLLQRKAPPSAALSDEAGQPLTHNLLGMLRDTGWAKQLPQLDAMTLELVAMLFDHIFEDARLSPSMKSLIGRLQIPVLKVGMLDAEFFSKKNHPARQFLDELANTSIENEALDLGTPRYEALALIVNDVLKQYDRDINVFITALEQLRQLNIQYEEQAAAVLAEEVDELATRELEELAHVTAEHFILQRLTAYQAIPATITTFLKGQWQPALTRAYGLQGENEPEFIRRVQAMDDLLWSIQPKTSADERFKMVNMLPNMLKTIEDGLNSISISKADSQIFFSELVQCHAAAIRNGIKPAPPLNTTPEAAPLILEQTHPEMQQSAPDINEELELDYHFDQEEEQQEAAPTSILPEKGEWVEWLDDESRVVRLRLSWVSPQQTRYLFTNRDTKGLAFLKAEVEEVIRSGRMTRLALEGSLTDRAIRNLMQDLA
ncbi:DUF1631 domain-containing protein [Chitinibacter fontanus]|uniref:DUF1631 domain-containing protein n=1 Tax=Chitinibacter fontanus TaxID=1737446 RepID=A0A7D5VBH2_9NEIS|nr:DUF1631 family protein [Chitinibacter fontanus]QLI82979.1 DUF1631 domain-containing protein [Chitinibacter fontanus]